MNRPDLTYITQNICLVDALNNELTDKNGFVQLYDIKPIIKRIPELVQLAEMLFDMTLSNPNSMVHQMSKKTLESLKI